MRVESREERVESSAWSLCSGLPLSTAKIAVPIRGQSGIYTGTHGDSAVRARPSAPTTHYLLPSSPSSLEKSTGLPLSTAKIAVPIRGQSGIYTGTHGGTAVRAHPSAPYTHFFLPYEELFVSIRVHSCPFVVLLFPPFVYFVCFVVHSLLNERTAQLPCGRAQARHPRTTFYLLLPTLYL